MASKSVHRVRRVDHESALEYRCRRFTNRFAPNPKKPSQRFCNHRGQVDSYISLRWDAIGLKIGPIQRSLFMVGPATGPRTSKQLASPEFGRLLREDSRSSNKAAPQSKPSKLQS